MELLLAVAEDSATLRSDMSAVYGVGGESDATDIALFFCYGHHRKAALATRAQCKHCIPLVGSSSLPQFVAPSGITLPGKPQSGKPWVRAEPGEPKALTRSSPCASAWTLDHQ